MVRVSDVKAARETLSKLMCDMAKEKLKNPILMDDTYKEEEVREGYESTQLENKYLKEIMENEMEGMSDYCGFMFAEDGKSFVMRCLECDNVLCVWDNNKQAVVMFDEATHKEIAPANKHRHVMYRQMALVINDGPSGTSVRMRLPGCALTGMRELFPDLDATYMGQDTTYTGHIYVK
jgi:hypothetical protein